MERVTDWEQVKCGCVGHSSSTSRLSHSISMVENWGRVDAAKIIKNAGLKIPGHSFIVYEHDLCYESITGGPELTPLKKYKEGFENGDVFIFKPDADAASKREAVNLAFDKYHNHGYGFLQTGLGFLPVLLFRRIFKQDVQNPFPWGIICSELQLRYLRLLFQVLFGKRKMDKGYLEAASLIKWVWKLDVQATDPALLMACEINDGIPT